MMTEQKAKEFLAVSDKLKDLNDWLKPFDTERNLLVFFFRKGLTHIGYRGGGYNYSVPFDEKLKKYVSDAVKKRRDEVEAEYRKLKEK